MEGFKWGISLLSAALGLSAVAYFSVTGNYSGNFLLYAGYAVAELVVFTLLASWKGKNKPAGS